MNFEGPFPGIFHKPIIMIIIRCQKKFVSRYSYDSFSYGFKNSLKMPLEKPTGVGSKHHPPPPAPHLFLPTRKCTLFFPQYMKVMK